ncbi:DNA translocase FtsK [Vagococcus vulneris]|uniref:DNA translocase FtsK n=1 Tax=Vagococcus vulneris TaxID=1977869 RepID=A0A429ZZC0_9ENTE|nr:DNA translocase FtsK [Vagococcus vulneris]RST99344.1 cell division protein FtsK [Vagococcus vulneris]
MVKKKQTKKTVKKPTAKQKAQKDRTTYFIIGIVFILFGLLGSFKLGFLGVLMANVFRLLVGNSYMVMAIFLIFYGALLMFLGKDPKFKRASVWIGGLIFYLGILLFLEIGLFKQINHDTPIFTQTWSKIYADLRVNDITQSVGGGVIGAGIYSVTYFLVSKLGSYIISIGAMIIGVLLFLNIGINDVANKVREFGGKSAGNIKEKSDKFVEEKKKLSEEKKKRKLLEKSKNSVVDKKPEAQTIQEKSDILVQPEQTELFAKPTPAPVQSKEEPDDSSPLDWDVPLAEGDNPDYRLPTISLLTKVAATDQSHELQVVKHNTQVLERTFDSFGVDAKVTNYSLGPSVTKFEVQPAIGVKVSKIVGLTDDIALALAAKDIRMEAPIPGKSVIGIEVPNQTTSMVSFREVMESSPLHPDKLLEVPLGRSISGDIVSADLTKMPHLLIAGSTGSGKSVCINGIISSILMKAKPNQVKLMMIDPKMVELNVYNGIPHLLTPVVTNPRKAAQALQKVVEEMEKRYELFAGYGVRNINGYNEMVQKHNQETGEIKTFLPYIVVIVDELADLMMVASNEVEDAIIRLAQMARAAGIHMILATQRPSVDVITGIIKANVPSRIAFAVSSGTDSRTIIDSNGAEKLLGRGDMLFVPMGENKPIRVQGAFISDGEVENIVDFVQTQQGANYVESMMPSEESTSGTKGSESEDDYYKDAKALVIDMQTASVSLLQRRFKIGYNRAARLVDELEANGIVGPSEGSKPRKVLVQSQEELIPAYDENQED